ncbi:MAG: hypothetical protein Kow0047_20060 [Anaerolineae bacterium]
MGERLLPLLARLIVVVLLSLSLWWAMSLRPEHDLAAPESGWAEQPWMQPPKPTSTPWPTPTPFPTATPTPHPTPTPTPQPTPEAWLQELVAEHGFDWRDRFIVVDQDRQRMIVAEAGVVIAELPVSTGDPDRHYRTPAWVGRVGEYWGTFSAFGVSADHGWYLFKDAGSILIHGAPYVWENGQKVYRELNALGAFPASRGCIRLRPEDAEWFTNWGPYGVPIIILPWTGPPAQG